MTEVTLRIENMSCGSCVKKVAQTLNALPQTQAREVQLGAARVSTTATAGELVQALGQAGFPAQVESGAA